MQYSSLKILLIDADPTGVQRLHRLLGPVEGMRFKLAHVELLKKGLYWLKKEQFDVVLLELGSEVENSLKAIGRIRVIAPKTPVVALGPAVEAELEIRSLSEGAQEFLPKDKMTAVDIVGAMRRAVARSQARAAPAAMTFSAAPPAPSSDPGAVVEEAETAAPAPPSAEVEIERSTPLSEASTMPAAAPTMPVVEPAMPAEVQKMPAEAAELPLAPPTEPVPLEADIVVESAGQTAADTESRARIDHSDVEVPPPPESDASVGLHEAVEPPGFLSFGTALDKVLQDHAEPSEPAPAPSPKEESPLETESSTADAFPTSDPLSEQTEVAREKAHGSTAPRALSDTVEKKYTAIVETARGLFEAAEKKSEPDGTKVMEAIWQTLEELRRSNELLEESVRQRRDYHSWEKRGANVAILSMRLGVALESDERRCMALGLCGMIHDVGMLTIPRDVLDSPRFTPEQLEMLRQHPLESRKIVEQLGSSFEWVGDIVSQVHERRDGGGYPRGLKGDQIHEVARILGLADTYEAMAHPRPDRKARSTYDALKEIVDWRNQQFDRSIIKALIGIVSIFPLGSLVQLNNGEIGRIVRVSANFPTRPSLEIILDSQGRRIEYTRFVVLENEPLLTIVDPAIPEDVLRSA